MYFSSTVIGPTPPSITVNIPGGNKGPVSNHYTPEFRGPTTQLGARPISNITTNLGSNIGVDGAELMIERGQLYLSIFGRYLDFGLVLVDTTFTQSITNKTEDLVTITDITWLSDIGVTTTLEVGNTITRHQTLEFDIKAFATEGRATVDSIFVITFDNGSTMVIDLYILRASSLVYSIVPDRRSYSESYTFKTEVVEFTSGVESRRQLMSSPKMTFDYKVTLTNKDITEYSKSMSQLSMYTPFAQPLWFYRTEIIGPHSSSSIIEFDTIDKPFKVGGYCAIIEDQLYPVLLRVIAITDTSIQVNVPFQIDGNFWVLPAVSVYNSTSVGNNYDTYELNTLSYKLTEF